LHEHCQGAESETKGSTWAKIGNLPISGRRPEAISSLRIPDFKGFLRMRIDKDGLAICPIGIRAVTRGWPRR
jgi:hypothetical protein